MFISLGTYPPHSNYQINSFVFILRIFITSYILYLSLSLSVSLYLFVCLSLYLFVYISLFVCLYVGQRLSFIYIFVTNFCANFKAFYCLSSNAFFYSFCVPFSFSIFLLLNGSWMADRPWHRFRTTAAVIRPRGFPPPSWSPLTGATAFRRGESSRRGRRWRWRFAQLLKQIKTLLQNYPRHRINLITFNNL